MKKTTRAEKKARETKPDILSEAGYSITCTACGKLLSIEDAFCKESDKKVMDWRFRESTLILFYCADCLKTI